MSAVACDGQQVVLGRAPVAGVLRFVQGDDFREQLRMVEPDRVTPKPWPAGSLWLDVVVDGRQVVRWDFVVVGSEASLSVAFADWVGVVPRGGRFHLKWLGSGFGVSSSGETLVAGPVVVVP